MRALPLAVAGVVVSLGACETGSPRHIAETLPDVTCTVAGPEAPDEAQRVRVPRAGSTTVEVGGFTFSAEYAGPSGERYLEVAVEGPSGEIVERVRYEIPGGGRLRNQFGVERDAITGDHRVGTEAGTGQVWWECGVRD